MRPLDLLQSRVSSLHHPITSQYSGHVTCIDQSEARNKVTWPVLTNQGPGNHWPLTTQRATDREINYLSIFIIKTHLRECWLFLSDLEDFVSAHSKSMPTPSKPRARSLKDIFGHNLGLNVSKIFQHSFVSTLPNSSLRSMLSQNLIPL